MTTSRVEQYTIVCDHHRYDSAAIRGGWKMASVVQASIGCEAQLGPYPTERSAEQSAEAAGWWLYLATSGIPGGLAAELAYCPTHKAEAAQAWAEVMAS